jgi:hypothetical protein
MLLAAGALAQDDLPPVHPDESAAYTHDRRFSLDQALTSLQTIRGALRSFAELTEQAQRTALKAKLKEVGNTDWEMQNLGFRNHAGSIEGALRLQDLRIKRLEFELAREQTKSGAASDGKLQQTEKAYKEADEAFRRFWRSFSIAD